MFGKTTTTETIDRAPLARGGISGGPILTGVVVAFGSMFLLSALVGGVLTAIGLEANLLQGDAIEASIGAGIALVVAQLLSYLWGGYTAGRMSRGAGLGNGLLVPLVAIIIAVAVGAVVAAMGATANLNLPFTNNQLPLENDNVVNWGLGIGIASLVAMFLGGAIGGAMGARWHTKLEHTVADEAREERIAETARSDSAEQPVVTEQPVATTTGGPPATGGAAATTTSTGTSPVSDSRPPDEPIDLRQEDANAGGTSPRRTYR
jgi:hypothetical protein